MKKYYHPTFLAQKPRIVIPVKFGLINDAHARTSQKILIKRTLSPMLRFNKAMETFKPDFIIQNGDHLEGTYRTEPQAINDWNTVNKLFNIADIPSYHTLGNHDLRALTRQKWLEMTGYEKAYYYFDQGVYRFIVLDANYIPRKDFEEEVSPGKEYIRGYVPKEQMRWLEDLLKESSGIRKIVFIHQPPLDKTLGRTKGTSFPVNSKELRSLFSKYKVRAVFSGHIEEKVHQEIDGVDYYVLPGFYKAQADPNGGSLHEIYHGVYTQVEAGSKVKIKMFYAEDETGKEYSVEL